MKILNMYLSRSTSEIRLRLAPSNMFSPPVLFTEKFQCGASCLDFFYICVSCLSRCPVCFLQFVVTCGERAYLFALLYAMFSYAFFTFLYGVLGQVWHLNLTI